jgi:hypothetical protein
MTLAALLLGGVDGLAWCWDWLGRDLRAVAVVRASTTSCQRPLKRWRAGHMNDHVPWAGGWWSKTWPRCSAGAAAAAGRCGGMTVAEGLRHFASFLERTLGVSFIA